MDFPQNDNETNNNVVKETSPDWEKAESDLLRTALKRSYTERFQVMMSLIKRGIMLKKATITLPPKSSINPE